MEYAIDMERLNDITLRAATAADIPIIVALIQAAFKEYDGVIDPPSGAHKENAERIREKLSTEHAALALDWLRSISSCWRARS